MLATPSAHCLCARFAPPSQDAKRAIEALNDSPIGEGDNVRPMLVREDRANE